MTVGVLGFRGVDACVPSNRTRREVNDPIAGEGEVDAPKHAGSSANYRWSERWSDLTVLVRKDESKPLDYLKANHPVSKKRAILNSHPTILTTGDRVSDCGCRGVGHSEGNSNDLSYGQALSEMVTSSRLR